MIGISQPITVEQAVKFLQGLPPETEVTNLTVSLDVEPDGPVEIDDA